MTDFALVGTVAAFGWLIGILLGLAARQLGTKQARPALPRGLRVLAADPALQAFQALALAALAIRFGPSVQLAIYATLSLVLILVLFVDLRTRFVYSAVAYPGILAGVVLTPIARGGVYWEGLASALLGASVFGALYLLGRLLYRGAVPLAGGDVIIAALVGSVVGTGQLVPAIFLGTLFSGLLALGFAIYWRSLRVYLPYGPGLCLGALVALLR
jgi:leader peptidase (prepilin peptidase)/N-methyltransferase